MILIGHAGGAAVLTAVVLAQQGVRSFSLRFKGIGSLFLRVVGNVFN
jgi:hypothetical protein